MNRELLAKALEDVRPRLETEPRRPLLLAGAEPPPPDLGRPLAEEPRPETDDAAFLPTDPVASMLQTELERKLRAERPELVTALDAGDLPEEPNDFTVDRDWHRWAGEFVKAIAARIVRGVRPFNPQPAEVEIADDARIVVVGDWGSGLPRARAVGGFMAEEVQAALAEGREAHVIHLGDVYFSGDQDEYDDHVLAPGLWPVTDEDAARGVASWSVNGNHDMYGGGWAYFDHLLGGQPRFANQRVGGAPTSIFRLRSSRWDILGLDTAWDSNRLTRGHSGVLEDPQADWVADVAAEGRRLMLLSHHQPTTTYAHGDPGELLREKLGATLMDGHVDAWIWGHEHRCMAFKPDAGFAVPFARLVGHGGAPVVSATRPHERKLWEYEGSFESRGKRWARFGFAVLDLQPDSDRIEVRYRNDLGEPQDPAAETLAPA